MVVLITTVRLQKVTNRVDFGRKHELELTVTAAKKPKVNAGRVTELTRVKNFIKVVTVVAVMAVLIKATNYEHCVPNTSTTVVANFKTTI